MSNSSLIVDVDGSRFITRKAVIKMVGLSYSTIWLMMTRGEFPRGYKISSNRTMWRLDQIIEFIESRQHAPLKGKE